VAATASLLMRAYRALDGSYFFWRAGAYDPTMSDATGSQTPPFPIVDYSDFVIAGFLEGPLARSDETAFALPGLGTPGVPITFGAGMTIQTAPGTDCRDYSSITVWVVITAAPSTPALLTLTSIWTNTPTPSTPADVGALRSDDAISNGDSPQNIYQAQYDVNGTTASSGAAQGPFNVPVRGRNHLLGIKSDVGDVEGYCIAMRLV